MSEVGSPSILQTKVTIEKPTTPEVHIATSETVYLQKGIINKVEGNSSAQKEQKFTDAKNTISNTERKQAGTTQEDVNTWIGVFTTFQDKLAEKNTDDSTQAVDFLTFVTGSDVSSQKSAALYEKYLADSSNTDAYEDMCINYCIQQPGSLEHTVTQLLENPHVNNIFNSFGKDAKLLMIENIKRKVANKIDQGHFNNQPTPQLVELPEDIQQVYQKVHNVLHVPVETTVTASDISKQAIPSSDQIIPTQSSEKSTNTNLAEINQEKPITPANEQTPSSEHIDIQQLANELKKDNVTELFGIGQLVSNTNHGDFMHSDLYVNQQKIENGQRIGIGQYEDLVEPLFVYNDFYRSKTHPEFNRDTREVAIFPAHNFTQSKNEQLQQMIDHNWTIYQYRVPCMDGRRGGYVFMNICASPQTASKLDHLIQQQPEGLEGLMDTLFPIIKEKEAKYDGTITRYQPHTLMITDKRTANETSTKKLLDITSPLFAEHLYGELPVVNPGNIILHKAEENKENKELTSAKEVAEALWENIPVDYQNPRMVLAIYLGKPGYEFHMMTKDGKGNKGLARVSMPDKFLGFYRRLKNRTLETQKNYVYITEDKIGISIPHSDPANRDVFSMILIDRSTLPPNIDLKKLIAQNPKLPIELLVEFIHSNKTKFIKDTQISLAAVHQVTINNTTYSLTDREILEQTNPGKVAVIDETTNTKNEYTFEMSPLAKQRYRQ